MDAFRTNFADGVDELDKDPSPRGADSTAAGSACSDGVASGARAWWTLIWCHERCHKQECQWKQSVIRDTAQGAGADLVCLKKAAKFATWMDQADRPFGLLTDWREVKPCLQSAEAHPLGTHPAFTVVYCELPKHHERASAWARSLPEWVAPVRILGDLGLLKDCLGDLTGFLSEAALCRRVDSRPPTAAPLACQAAGLSGYRLGPPGQHHLHAKAEDEEEAQEARFEKMRKQRDSMWLACWTGAQQVPQQVPQQAPQQCQQARAQWGTQVIIPQFQPMQPQSPIMQPQSPVQPQTPVGCVYIGTAPCAEPPQVQRQKSDVEMRIECLLMEGGAEPGDHMETTVEQMLRKAMPDHYDD